MRALRALPGGRLDARDEHLIRAKVLTMIRPLFALRLLERLDADGAREALLGDLIEEIGLGRPRFWVWQQILALCGLAALRRVRYHAASPPVIALAPGLFLMGALWIAPLAKVLATWAVFYFIAGALSLLGDLIASRTDNWGALGSARTRAER